MKTFILYILVIMSDHHVGMISQAHVPLRPSGFTTYAECERVLNRIAEADETPPATVVWVAPHFDEQEQFAITLTCVSPDRVDALKHYHLEF